MKIHFADNGQDFTEWEIDPETGKVLDCLPFQAWLWANGERHVELESIEVGKPPFCYKTTEDAEQKMGQFFGHVVEKIEPASA